MALIEQKCKLSETVIYLLTTIVESDPKQYQIVYNEISDFLAEKYIILRQNESIMSCIKFLIFIFRIVKGIISQCREMRKSHLKFNLSFISYWLALKSTNLDKNYH